MVITCGHTHHNKTIPHNSNLLYCIIKSHHTWSYQEHEDKMWTHHTITFLPIYHAWVAKHTNSVWLIISSIVLFFHLPIHYWLNSFIIILLASINNSSFYLPGHSKAFTCRVKNGGQLLPEMQLQIISATTHMYSVREMQFCKLCEALHTCIFHSACERCRYKLFEASCTCIFYSVRELQISLFSTFLGFKLQLAFVLCPQTHFQYP